MFSFYYVCKLNCIPEWKSNSSFYRLFVMAKRVRKFDEEIQDAVEIFIKQNPSIRSVAESRGISKPLLADLVKKKHKESPEVNFKYIRNI